MLCINNLKALPITPIPLLIFLKVDKVLPAIIILFNLIIVIMLNIYILQIDYLTFIIIFILFFVSSLFYNEIVNS